MPTLETVFKRLDEPLQLGYWNVGTIFEIPCSMLHPPRFQVGDWVVSNEPYEERCVYQRISVQRFRMKLVTKRQGLWSGKDNFAF